MSIYFIKQSQQKFTKILDKQFFKESLDDSPLLILYGWSGCKLRHISKYYEIYREFGFNCILIKSVIDLTITVLKIHSKQLVSTIDLYLKSHVNCNSIISQFMSVGGCTYLWSMREINRNPKYRYILPKFKGQVADSSIPNSPRGVFKGFSKTLFQVNKLLVAFSIFIPIFFPIYYYCFSKGIKYISKPENEMYSLVIHSKKDDLFFKDIHRFIGMLKSNSTNEKEYITEIYFEESGHVQHFVKYPTQYKEAVSNLIKQVFNISNNQVIQN